MKVAQTGVAWITRQHHLEELGQRDGGCPKVWMANDVVTEPCRHLATIAGAGKALICEYDGPVVVTMSDDPAHGLVHCPAQYKEIDPKKLKYNR